MKWCRNCTWWTYTGDFKGNCQKHPWDHDKYSQDADAESCPHYQDKSIKCQEAVCQGKKS